MAQKLPSAEFAQLIKNAPLISIDLVVRTAAGKLLLGLRNNEPARGCYFVPGGRIFKDERMADAFGRVAREELGIELKMTTDNVTSLGAHEHFYDTNALGLPGFGTHYVVLAYKIQLADEIHTLPPSQHSRYLWMAAEQALNDPLVHENSKAYIRMKSVRHGSS